MSTYTPTAQDIRALETDTKVTTRQPSKGGPVLMADCSTPVAGETLLSLLWKRWDTDS